MISSPTWLVASFEQKLPSVKAIYHQRHAQQLVIIFDVHLTTITAGCTRDVMMPWTQAQMEEIQMVLSDYVHRSGGPKTSRGGGWLKCI